MNWTDDFGNAFPMNQVVFPALKSFAYPPGLTIEQELRIFKDFASEMERLLWGYKSEILSEVDTYWITHEVRMATRFMPGIVSPHRQVSATAICGVMSGQRSPEGCAQEVATLLGERVIGVCVLVDSLDLWRDVWHGVACRIAIASGGLSDLRMVRVRAVHEFPGWVKIQKDCVR